MHLSLEEGRETTKRTNLIEYIRCKKAKVDKRGSEFILSIKVIVKVSC